MRRHRWLFVSPRQFGHLLVQLAVVDELRRRGDDVFVYAPEDARHLVTAAGGTAVTTDDGALFDIELAMRRAAEQSGWQSPVWASQRMRLFLDKRERELRFRRTVQSVAERTAAATRELARRLEVEAVVADVLAFGARFGAELAGLPFATIAMDPVFAYDHRGVPLHLPHASAGWLPPRVWHGLVDLALPLRRVRGALGLPRRDAGSAADFYGQMVSPTLHVVPAPAWFMGSKPGPHHAYVGPMAFSPPDESRAAPALDVNRQTVLITGSTTGHPRARAMLTKTVRAFAETDLDVVVTAGPVGGLFGELPCNVRVVEGFVRHEDVIPRAGALVSHGGWGTVGRALRSGTPSMIVPAFGPQFSVAARIEATDLGRALALEDISPGRVRDVARDLLTNERIRAMVKRASSEIAATDPAALAADALTSLLS